MKTIHNGNGHAIMTKMLILEIYNEKNINILFIFIKKFKNYSSNSPCPI